MHKFPGFNLLGTKNLAPSGLDDVKMVFGIQNLI